MTDQLTAMRLFVRVARLGSFSRAAKEQNISQPTISRTVALLEEKLGATLLTRNTRAVTLTEAGTDYLARIQPILDALDEADHGVRGTGELRGVLRVGTSSILASRVIVPRLSGFTTIHPALRVELVIDDKRQDLINEGVDLAIRTGALTDSNALARKIAQWPLMIVAAPAYLAAHGTPQAPAELARHSAIVAGPMAGSPWVFRRGEEQVSVKPGSGVAISASAVAVDAAVAGLGIALATRPSFGRELSAGTLIRLLPDWSLGQAETHALYPSGQAAKPAAKAFTEFLIRELHDL